MVGAVPERYGWDGASDVDLDTYFAMARGRQTGGVDVTAMEMTKWFDTNYHYIVPELERGHEVPLQPRASRWSSTRRRRSTGSRPSPCSSARSASCCRASRAGEEFDRLTARPASSRCTPRSGGSWASWARVGADRRAGAGRGPHPGELEPLERAYEHSPPSIAAPKIVATYFDHVGDAYPVLAGCRSPACTSTSSRPAQPRAGRAARLARGQDPVRRGGRRPQRLDQRPRAASTCSRSCERRGDRVVVSTSCSLLHSPVDKRNEPRLDAEVRRWMRSRAEARRGGR